MLRLLQGIIFACNLAQVLGQSQPDPLADFCRRWGHQTAVIGNKLFIDGGYVNYGSQIMESTYNYTNTALLWADLNSTSSNQFPPQYKNLTKPANVPSVAGGTLWADDINQIIYLWGGEFPEQPPETYSFWFYDALYNTWNLSTPASAPPASIVPPAYGASTVDPNNGVGYYYGGWRSSHTSYSVSVSTASSNLIRYDFAGGWTSLPFIDDTGRAEGALFYIPASDDGMLIYFGGVQETTNGSMGVSLETIYIFDILSGVYYQQSTSGSVPPMRRKFCGGVSWPEDQSSYNIYIYGGLPPYEVQGFGFDDVYVLSIPSFTWTSLWTTTQGHPHYSLTCNVVKNGQMMVIGGEFANTSYTACDSPQTLGMHNLNLGFADAANVPWYPYLTNITEYTLPPNLTAVIGGSSRGGATDKAPEGNWDNPDLAVLLPRKAATGTRTATRATSIPVNTKPTPFGHHLNTGAIVGIVIGTIVGFILLLLAALVCLRSHRRRRRPVAPPAHATHPSTSFEQTPQLSASSPHLSLQHQYSTLQHKPGFREEDRPPQQYFSPPPQAQPYYPPPPLPQLHEQQIHHVELPSVRSPVNLADTESFRNRSGGPLYEPIYVGMGK